MNIHKIGGIDIGSNAVRLLVNTVIPGETYKDAILQKTAYLRLPLRLGGDVFKYDEIRQEKADMLVRVMEIFSDLLEFYGVQAYRACATSATRDSKNGMDIIKRVQDEIGIKIDVIDGYEESLLLYETNKYNLPEGKTFLSADLGGGSLQLTLFEGDNLIWSHSYKIGTVRIISNTVNYDEYKILFERLNEIKNEYEDVRLIGSGGNINKVSKILNQKFVEYDSLIELHSQLNKLDINQRILTHNLRPDRADVIIPAIETYMMLMKKLDKTRIYVPKIGLADGIIRKIYEDKNL